MRLTALPPPPPQPMTLMRASETASARTAGITRATARRPRLVDARGVCLPLEDSARALVSEIADISNDWILRSDACALETRALVETSASTAAVSRKKVRCDGREDRFHLARECCDAQAAALGS